MISTSSLSVPSLDSGKLSTMLTLSGLATEVSAQEVGLDRDRLARLDHCLDNYVTAGRQKGSLIAICRGGKLAHISMRGFRDEAAGVPVEADTAPNFKLRADDATATCTPRPGLFGSGVLQRSARARRLSESWGAEVCAGHASFALLVLLPGGRRGVDRGAVAGHSPVDRSPGH